jgi:hypothetical protein
MTADDCRTIGGSLVQFTNLRTKWRLAAGSVAAVALCLIGSIAVPRAVKAFTLIEMPAWVFPEITVEPSQVPMLCANNMGDGSVRGLIGLLNVADATASVTPLQAVAFGPHQGTCMLLPAVQTTANGVPAAATIIPLIAIQGAPGQAQNVVASIQLRDAAGTHFVTSPTFMNSIPTPGALVP